MIFSVQIDENSYRIDLDEPLDISITMNFNSGQPNAYGVEKARSTACESGEIVGDTRRGGSCNFEQISFIPHCSGTHTECVGHITDARISIVECLRDAFVSAILVSVEPENARETADDYPFEPNENDRLITRQSLEKALAKIKRTLPNHESLIVRTLPNDDGKLTRTYLDEIPPFFSNDAMNFLREKNFKHLLVDLPSIDRIFDEGKLSNHRIFWNVKPGAFEVDEQSLIHQTITELIYVSDEIIDGEYFLNLQIAPFAADAAPSRPLLFRCENVGI